MYIIVRIDDNVIVGTSNNPVNVSDLSKRGRRVYEVDETSFDKTMVGKKLTDYELLD